MANNVWTFGNNQEGQLGLGDGRNRYIPTQIVIWKNNMQAKAVSCGFYHTVIIDLANNVWVSGLMNLDN